MRDGSPARWWPLPLDALSCCCESTPIVQAVLPATGRCVLPVEVLLCGEHFRTCRQGLVTAGAQVFDATGLALCPPVGSTPRRANARRRAAVTRMWWQSCTDD